MEPWHQAWLAGTTLPSHSIPRSLLETAQEIAEQWFVDNNGPRRQVEEWVSGDQAYAVMDGLLWSGFRLKGNEGKRCPPVPVLVRLCYQALPPADDAELWENMRDLFGSAFREWIQGFVQHGNNLETAL